MENILNEISDISMTIDDIVEGLEKLLIKAINIQESLVNVKNIMGDSEDEG